MDTVIGIVGKDFVLLAADTSRARSIVVLKGDDDKIMHLDSHKLLGASGETGDAHQFCEFIQKNINFNRFKSDIPLSTDATANFIRNQLATALRQNPYSVNLLLGGYDKNGPSLYFLDYLANMHKMKYAVHGYAGNFLLSILDKDYKDGLTVEEALTILNACMAELKIRFLINSPRFIVKVVDQNGIRVLDY